MCVAHFPELFRVPEILVVCPHALYSRNRCAKLIFVVRNDNLCQFGIKFVKRIVCVRNFCQSFGEKTESLV